MFPVRDKDNLDTVMVYDVRRDSEATFSEGVMLEKQSVFFLVYLPIEGWVYKNADYFKPMQ